MVWLAFAFMSVAAVLCVSWPLLRPGRTDDGRATDVVFYRQQLGELDADVERGLLRSADVEATRAELGRRLLSSVDAAAGRAPVRGRGGRIAVSALAGCFVLAIAAGLYARVGNPNQPDQPLASRETGKSDFASAMAKIEAHLAASPDDGRGFELVAPIYMRMGRFDDAVRAYREASRVLGATPSRRAELGQAMVMAADGVVTGEARQVFDSVLKDDPVMPQARFFRGLAALQDGDKAKARGIWTEVIAEAPPEAPYLGILRQRVAELDGKAPPVAAVASPPSPGGRAMPGMPAGAAAIAALPADQQQTAIRGMVDGLAAKLAQNGQDAEGWLRLVRAYRVLGDEDKARRALADARKSMGGNPQVLGRLDQLAHELGLEG